MPAPTDSSALKESFDSVYGWVEQVLEVASVSWNEHFISVSCRESLQDVQNRSKRDTLRKLWEVLGACIVELTVD